MIRWCIKCNKVTKTVQDFKLYRCGEHGALRFDETTAAPLCPECGSLWDTEKNRCSNKERHSA